MIRQEFTGERFIPGQGGVQLAYEHVHRYLYALGLACGRQVLDVASGSGYGTGLLAKVARNVWAIDIDATTLTAARDTVLDANICFINADGSRLPFPAGVFDLITAFEVIEHVPNQAGMVRELARVLKPGGIALISTPNRAEYTDARKYVNPFHLREFYREEFLELLRAGFAFTRLMQQQVRAGSLISGDDSSARPGAILTNPPPGEERSVTSPMYFLACCSNAQQEPHPGDSAYFDPADSLFREWKRRETDAAAEFDRLNEEIERLGAWGKTLDDRLAKKDATLRQVLDELEKRDLSIRTLQASLVAEINGRDETIRRLQGELERDVAKRDQIIRDLQDEMLREISRRDQDIQKLQQGYEERTKWALSLDERLRQSDADLARIRRAFSYRVLSRIGILPK